MSRSRTAGYALVLLAATLWATMGLIYTQLIGARGLPPLTIVFWRAAVAALGLLAFALTRQRSALRLAPRHWPLMGSFGLIGIAGFYVLYIHAVRLTGVGVAAVLMYSAPAWVAVISRFVLAERLGRAQKLALVLAVSGCALVGQAYDMTSLRLNWLGLLAGLGAGLAYGLYTVFCKAAAQRGLHPLTVQIYALALGALVLLPLQSPQVATQILRSPTTLSWLLLLGLPTLGGGLAFSAAMRHLPASTASIVATVEPLMAMFLGWLLLAEKIAVPQLAGAGLIVVAVFLLQARPSALAAVTSQEGAALT